MNRIFLAGLIFFNVNLGLAQEVYVLNPTNNEPIEGVIIYSPGKSHFVSTNHEGIVDLSEFSREPKIIFQHPSYHSLALTQHEIADMGSKIFLREKIIKIDEVVISANKWEQNKSEIPFEIMTLGPGEILSKNAQTSADLLEATGQVFVQKSQLGGGSPMIRGFGANAVLIVVDGIRINNTIFRGGNLQNIINLDPNTLESSEIIFGPGAVIYGSDALGGVMDFHTVSPLFSSDQTLRINGHAMARYSSANNERTGHVLINLGKKRIGYAGSLTFNDFGDLKTGSIRPENHPNFGKRPEYVITIDGRDSTVHNNHENLQRFSAYKQFSTLHKLAFRLNNHLEVGYTFNFSTTSDIPRYDRLTEYNDGTLKYAKWYYGPQRWMMNALKIGYVKPTDLFDAIKATIAFQHFEESRHDRRYRESTLRNRKEKVGVFTLNIDVEKDLTRSDHFFYGLEYALNQVNSSAFSLNVTTQETSDLSTRYPDGGSNVHSFALYSSYKKDVTNTLFFNSGIRFNYQNLVSQFNDETLSFSSIKNVSSAVNGNLGLVLKPNPNWNISGVLSSGFRAPNVDDISKVFDSEPGNVVVPNPDLKPEHSYNTEVSLSRYFDNKLAISGTFFYSFLRDAMVRGNYAVNGQDSILYDGVLSRVQAVVNTGKANIFGFSAALQIDLSANWSARAHIHFVEGKDLISDEPLRHTTPPFGMTTIQYNRKRFGGEFFVRFNGKRDFDDLPPSERSKPHLYSTNGSPAWYTLNLRLQHQVNDFIQMSGSVENILDHHYRTYSSGISAPGRNFVVSIRAKL